MKYLAFSALLILAAYGIATLLIKLIKPSLTRNTLPLSRDAANVCKGIAIGIIMLAHIGNTFGVRFLTPLGSWGVGIFLFLSGYGLELSTKKSGLQAYWKKRILTAWLPYAVAEAIGFLLRATPEYAQVGPLEIVLDLLLLRTVHPFGWYMQCLFLYYIGFYLAHKLFHNSKIGKYAVLLALSTVLFICFRSLFKQQILTFIFGVLVADSAKVREKAITKPVFGLLSLAAGGMFLLIRQTSLIRALPWVYEPAFSLQVVFLTVGTINLVCWLYTKIKPVFFEAALLLGLISYELYLYHGWIYSRISEKPISYPLIILFFLGSIAVATPIYLIRSKLSICLKKAGK